MSDDIRIPRRKVPEPHTELGGGGFSPPALVLAPPIFNKHLIGHLSERLRLAADKALLWADRRFLGRLKKARAEGSVDRLQLAALKQAWFWDVLLEFVKAAQGIVAAGTGKAARFGEWCDAMYEAAADAAGIDDYRPLVDAELKNSPEWRKFQKIHAKVLAAPVPAVSATAAPEPATMPAAEPRTFGEWAQEQMKAAEIESAYRIHKLGGPTQPTTWKVLDDLPTRDSKKHKVVEAINKGLKNKGFPPVYPPERLLPAKPRR